MERWLLIFFPNIFFNSFDESETKEINRIVEGAITLFRERNLFKFLDRKRVFAVEGINGSGKTTYARKLAYRLREVDSSQVVVRLKGSGANPVDTEELINDALTTLPDECQNTFQINTELLYLEELGLTEGESNGLLEGLGLTDQDRHRLLEELRLINARRVIC